MAKYYSVLALLVLFCCYGELEAKKRECPKICQQNYAPVCGSDGKTYGNLCMLNAAICKNPSLRLKHNGECKHSSCDKPCTKEYDPHCGSDGKTYGNKCMFEIAKCKNPRLRLVKRGECSANCNKACIEIYRPVCGSDRKTYSNKCFFENAHCKNRRLRIVKFGPCSNLCNKSCTKIYRPVCGSDGKTYNNKCLFDIAKCKNPRLSIASNGRCAKNAKPGKCGKARKCYGRRCRNIRRRDHCQTDANCPGPRKCCNRLFGNRCAMPCRMLKCKACKPGYKHTIDRHGCPSCRCVCARTWYCFVSPCQFARCPRYPEARCRANFCGGCKAEFYVGKRKVDCKLPQKGK